MAMEEFSGKVAEVRVSYNCFQDEIIATVELHDLMAMPHVVNYIACSGGMLQQARLLNPLEIVTITAEFANGKYWGRSIIGNQPIV